MRTVDGVLAEIRHLKPCSKPQLYRYFAAFKITPLGVRTRPRLYPDDTAHRILTKLGLVPATGASSPAAPVEVVQHPHSRIVSMPELRAERAKARKARRAA